MYLLDTNVVSELRRSRTRRADRNVVTWANSVTVNDLFLSVISVLEIEIGVSLVERRDTLQGNALRDWLDEQVLPTFAGRILPVDTAVARACARFHVPNPLPDRDALIAATASVNGMIIVTRNVSGFALTGIEIVNPWNYEGTPDFG